jgi:hypothetical protein
MSSLISSCPPRARWRHRLVALAASLALGTSGLVALAAPAAHAAATTITCTGSSPITYSPGLTFTPTTSTYQETDNYSSCLSSDPAVTTGSAYSSYTDSFSCLALPSVVTDPGYRVHWNDGQVSTFSLTYTDTIAAGVENVTGIGTVISGYLTGATATFVWVYTLPNALACLSPGGATSQNGTVVATILATS